MQWHNKIIVNVFIKKFSLIEIIIYNNSDIITDLTLKKLLPLFLSKNTEILLNTISQISINDKNNVLQKNMLLTF